MRARQPSTSACRARSASSASVGAGHAVLGVIEQQRARLERKLLRAARGAREQLAHRYSRDFSLVRLQRLPCRALLQFALHRFVHGFDVSFVPISK